MVQVALKNFYKRYDKNVVVKNINLDINDKEFVVLVGPSGCGKSTTLRMIAGLEEISGGDLYIGDNIMNDVPAKDRNVAMVFQDYALYPHMSVYENMAFSLRIKKKLDKKDVDQRVKEAALMLDIDDYLDRKPKALSGGQRQRVAMGRAIVKKASVFLFDEPLSNLDAKLRSKMRVEIKKFHQQTKTTTIYVTHDQLEAMTLADRLVVMNEGIIEQVGTPLEVFENPRSVFVATFIGSPSMNLIDVKVKAKGEDYYVEGDGSSFKFKLPKEKVNILKGKDHVIMGIRPSDIFPSDANDGLSDDWKTEGELEVMEVLGKNAYLDLKVGQVECVGEVVGNKSLKPGDKIKLSFNLNYVHFFDPEGKLNLNLNIN